MVSLALSLALLPTWTYAGFMARPGPPPPPAATNTPTASASGSGAAPVSPPVALDPPVAPPEVPPPLPEPARGPVESVGLPTTPRLYQLADVSGQVWEHPDPVWLQEFVQGRNHQLLASPR